MSSEQLQAIPCFCKTVVQRVLELPQVEEARPNACDAAVLVHACTACIRVMASAHISLPYRLRGWASDVRS